MELMAGLKCKERIVFNSYDPLFEEWLPTKRGGSRTLIMRSACGESIPQVRSSQSRTASCFPVPVMQRG
jgi:hypothetical protein